MSTEKNPATMTPQQMAIENIKMMFRLTMLENFRNEGESVADLKARLAADAGTATVAQMLRTSVEELLDTFGEEQRFFTPEGYDHKTAMAEVNKIIEAVAAQRTGVYEGELAEDGKAKSGTQMGVLAAPRDGERKSQILANDAKSAELLKQNLQQVRSKGGGTAVKKAKEDDDEDTAKQRGPQKRGMTAKFKK